MARVYLISDSVVHREVGNTVAHAASALVTSGYEVENTHFLEKTNKLVDALQFEERQGRGKAANADGTSTSELRT